MTRDEIETHVREMYATFASGDVAAYRTAFADEIVWHVPGDNPVSGAYRGPDEYFGTMVERMAPLDEWRFEVTGLETNERDRAALVAFHVVGRRRGVRIDTDGHHMIRLDDAGRIVEGWGFTADQAALDAFFAA
jgi:ketosteroid isomerase-like protein